MWPDLMHLVRKIKECLTLSNVDKHNNVHPKTQYFHEHFRSKRNKDSDYIYSFPLIYLPFPMKENPHNVKRCEDKENCHYIDVDLIIMADNDYLDGDNCKDDRFQIV